MIRVRLLVVYIDAQYSGYQAATIAMLRSHAKSKNFDQMPAINFSSSSVVISLIPNN